MQQVTQPPQSLTQPPQPLTRPPEPLPRIDPSPSRLKYRMERLMLTPLFRLGLRVGLPLAIGFGAVSLYFSYEDNRQAFVDGIAEIRNQIETRPEFMVGLMAIDGASDGVAEDIREILPIDFPISSFDLPLDLMREAVTELDAVKSAHVRIRKGGVLQIEVTERVPVALWRQDGGLELLDEDGVRVGPAQSRGDHPGLPVIAGVGAQDHVAEARAIIDAARPLHDRLRGLERIGERRWDVVLDREQRIMLPEEGAVTALERTIAMDQAVDLLARDIASVDLRLAQRPTLRLRGEAVQEYWRIKAMETGEKQQ